MQNQDWQQITCVEADCIRANHALRPISADTDLSALRHDVPTVFTEWGDADTEVPVLREYRFPAHWDDYTAPRPPDTRPCEHYVPAG